MAPTATTHEPQAADGPLVIPEPEHPRRRRSNRHPATRRQFADAAGVCFLTPRGALRAARPAAGPTTPHRTTACPSLGGPPGYPPFAPARRACCVAGVGAPAERRTRALAAARAARLGPP
ncbi:hypothetical protein GCM10012279_57410 [Micromonospora yangpuensis]|nr:hypothetical protein GCM10012279_57410 [Micromonospora yangpuensis]